MYFVCAAAEGTWALHCQAGAPLQSCPWALPGTCRPSLDNGT